MMLDRQIAEHKIIAILRNVPLAAAEDYIGAAYDGGVRMLEIALNSPDALGEIRMARRLYDGRLIVGAGTAVTVRLAQEAVDAGAQFLLSPSSDADVLAYCRDREIGLIPGVMTPTDVSACLRFGFHTLKLFPAGDLPAHYIRSLQGPFSDTRYLAVGGVGPANIREFFARGFIGVGIGSSLIPRELAEQKRWDEARHHVAGLVEMVR